MSYKWSAPGLVGVPKPVGVRAMAVSKKYKEKVKYRATRMAIHGVGRAGGKWIEANLPFVLRDQERARSGCGRVS